MTIHPKPLSEITDEAIEVLARELGIVAALRFVNQFTTGYGNYTAEREALMDEHTLDEILSEIRTESPQSNA